MLNLKAIYTKLPDDGADDEFGRVWSIESTPFNHPLRGWMEHKGIIGERLDADGRLEVFHWEAWCPVADTDGVETYAEGRCLGFHACLRQIEAVWACWGLGYDEATTERPVNRPWSFSESMAGRRAS